MTAAMLDTKFKLDEKPRWDERFKRTYGDVIGLIGFIVTTTADQGADIAIRALPILAPMPNAISVFYVSGETMGFNNFQSFCFAAAIELSMFGLFEMVLKMFDGLQINPRLYKWPFWVSVAVAAGIMVLVMVVVAWLETKHRILSVLPLFSAAGATALVLRRWHERNMNAVSLKKSVARTVANSVARPVAIVAPKRIDETENTPMQHDDATLRQGVMLQIMQQEGDIGATAFGKRLDVNRTTIYRDLEALEAAGAIYKSDKGWKVREAQ